LPLLKAGTVGIFPKGREIKEELAEAEKLWTLNYALVPSRTDPEARLVVVTGLTPR
jgi:16S rRNA (guanine527-N7)-methyltransferase